MKTRIDWNLIISYLDGNCSETQEKLVLDWAAESARNKEELEMLREVWDNPTAELPKPDVEKALQKVKNSIDKIENSAEVSKHQVINAKKGFQKSNLIDLVTLPRFVKFAGVFALLIVGVFFISRIINEETVNKIIVNNKTIKEIILPDSTKVTLDAGSILKYGENFEKDVRVVYLNGEGYFEVTVDKDKPFIVHTASSNVFVIGTRFNLRAWETNDKEVVAVVEGIVRFGSDDSRNNNSAVIVRKGQMSYAESGSVSTPVNINVQDNLSWMKREMKFQSAPLDEVLTQLERWYDIQFTLPDETYKSERITFYIENKPLNDILDVLSLIMKFNYERKGNKIEFLPVE